MAQMAPAAGIWNTWCRPGSSVFGVQGLAPYGFDVEAAAFISHRGEVSAPI
jgi:uncharacterized protein involved in copper resistance